MSHSATDVSGTTGCHTALLLYTSGTISSPKLVPLSSENLAASARHIAQALALGPGDRCLNIMPLFHVHGLLAAVLASLCAGASVVCTDGVYASRFFAWMREFRPTWYTAVPAMHQGILARAPSHRDVIGDVPLRFIRSSSAPLPSAVLRALEAAFHAPVVEAYGMTEAAHQISSNPVDFGRRKPGSVGLAAGPDIAIMASSGELSPRGVTGEVVIRGPNVMAGYRNNETANAEAQRGDWFRTGDEGSIDEGGYLYLTGRLKEVINRGGEKISPREVLYCIPGHDGILLGLARLARALPADQPVWAFDLRRLGRSASIDALATRCLDLLLAQDADGPYRLAGVCFGGVVAAALAHHLEARGRRVESLALVDSLNPAWSHALPRSAAAGARLAQLREKARYHTARIRAMDTASRLRYVSGRAADFLRNHGEFAGALLGFTLPAVANRRLVLRHTPRAVAASAVVIRIRGRRPHAPGLGWVDVFRGGVTTIDVPFAPHGALAAGSVGRVASILCDASRDGA